jgi:hypothetical protein
MLRVTSFQIGTLQQPAISYPEVRLLDGNLSVTRVIAPDAFALRASTELSELGATVFLNDSAQRYVIITNRPIEDAQHLVSQTKITTRTTVSVPMPGGTAMWMIPSGTNSAPVKMLAAAAGKLEVGVEEYRLRKVGQ